MSKKVISFRTDKEQIDIVHSICHGSSISPSEFIRRAIENHIEAINKHYLDKQTSKEVKSYLESIK